MKALALAPDSPKVLCQAAEFFAKYYQNDKAIPILEGLVDTKQAASHVLRSWARRTLASCLMSTRDPAARARAFELLETNRREQPDSLEDLRAQAIFSTMDPHKGSESVRLFLDLEARRGLDPREQLLLVEQLEKMGRREQAELRMARLVASNESDPAMLCPYAESLIIGRRLVDASRWLNALERRDPQALHTIILKAHLALAEGDRTTALEMLKTHAASHEGPARLSIAGELEAAGDVVAAEEMYRRHAAAGSTVNDSLPLARLLARQGRTRESLALCEPAWSRPADADAAASICLMAMERGKPGPEDFRNVEVHLESARQSARENTKLLLSLSRLRKLQHRWDEAVSLLRQATDRDPRNVVALNELAWILSQHRGNPSEGMQIIQQAIAVAGPDSVLLDTRGVLAMELNQTGQAIADFKTADTIQRRPVLLLHLAQAYQRASDRQASLQYLEQAKALGLDSTYLDPAERQAIERLERQLEVH